MALIQLIELSRIQLVELSRIQLIELSRIQLAELGRIQLIKLSRIQLVELSRIQLVEFSRILRLVEYSRIRQNIATQRVLVLLQLNCVIYIQIATIKERLLVSGIRHVVVACRRGTSVVRNYKFLTLPHLIKKYTNQHHTIYEPQLRDITL